MSRGKKVSVFIILLIVIIIFFFGYNTDYEDRATSSFIIVLLLLFSYMGLTMSQAEKIIGKNPGKFLHFPLRKIRYIILSTLYTIIIIFLVATTFSLSLRLSKNRKNTILSSSETKNMTGFIIRTDSIKQRYGKKPVAYLNYRIDNKNYEFEFDNQNEKFKIHQKIKLKYSLEHPDMFEIIK
ncbi:hypothetical protein [Chryseobacterium sp. Mn2064]|uniref:hypothetical protein n=1 Tax=Chryseobacterium sp. Mn2064 TaxID=3395263 RepID=UPI003BD11537